MAYDGSFELLSADKYSKSIRTRIRVKAKVCGFNIHSSPQHKSLVGRSFSFNCLNVSIIGSDPILRSVEIQN